MQDPVLKIPGHSPPPELKLSLDAEQCFNYAAWQNSTPLLRKVEVENPTDAELTGIKVNMTASPAFVQPRSWVLDRIGAGASVEVQNVDLDINAEYLDRLDEAVRGKLSFQLLRGEETLVEAKHELRVLARDEWGGMESMGELLPAFVTPNDPALVPLLRSASEILEADGHPAGLDGYQTRDRNRSYLLAASLWSAIAARSLTYANPPSSFEQVGQKTRRVATVLSDGLATCLDSTLLFASGLEAMGLNPVLVMTQGHCFVGVWLVEQTLKKLNEPDPSELRKAIAAKELIVFETTLVTHRPVAGFPEAIEGAEAALVESLEHKFIGAIDVSRARMSQVRPLATHGEHVHTAAETVEVSPPSLPASPGYEKQGVEEEPLPQTPDGRIERWQRKLLDLSMRNRLLNLWQPSSKQMVSVLCPDVSKLEDLLADGKRMRMVSVQDENNVGQRDPELHQRRTQKDLDLEFARKALERNEVACPLESRDLELRLTTLYRRAKSELAEGGSNTLFLAVGMLRWKQTPTGEKTHRAPLLLVPVKLTRRSVSSPYYLKHHEDDVRFNATLLQLLKKDFDCDLTTLESNLPMDDSGVDVPEVLRRMRQAVRDIPGFEVVEDAAIACFSFAKYLMWKDLVERSEQLERNRVVRHLLNDPDKAFVSDVASPIPRAHEMDTRYDPKEIVHPLPADSSQLSAVMAASEGHDMVIVGPPGTGKSQTIANLIAQCLSVGKTVLFVAEKTAALDVVHRRLRQHGLGDCCVELHSNKAERRRMLDQLEASWKRRGRPNDSEWLHVSERLKVRRNELNRYVAAIHTERANGLTVYQTMGCCVLGRETQPLKLKWPSDSQHSREDYAKLKSCVEELSLALQALPEEGDLGRLEATEWSMAWEGELLDVCRKLQQAAASLSQAVERFTSTFNLKAASDVSSTELTLLYHLAHTLAQRELPDTELVLHQRRSELTQSLQERADLIGRREAAGSELKTALENFAAVLGDTPTEETQAKKSSYYRVANELIREPLPKSELVFHQGFDGLPERLADRERLLSIRNEAWSGVEARGFNASLIKRLNLKSLESDWVSACAAFWPLSILRKSGVKKKLQSFMNAGAVADAEVDLPLLREHVDAVDALSENLESLALPAELQASVEEAPASVHSELEEAKRIRESLVAAGLNVISVGETSGNRWEPLVEAARQLYPPGREVEQLRRSLQQNLESLEISPDLQAEVEQDAKALDTQLKIAGKLSDTIQSLHYTEEVVRQLLASSNDERRSTAADYCRKAKVFLDTWKAYTKLAGDTPAATDSLTVVSQSEEQAERILSGRRLLKSWTGLAATRRQASKRGLSPLVEEFQSTRPTQQEAVARFELEYARWWLPVVVDGSDTLRAFQRVQHEDAIQEFCELDELARQAAAPRATKAIYHDLPSSDQVPRKSELGLLRHQLGLKRPSKSIREVIGGMPESFGKLAPCLMMSPLSIAQYLPADQAPFDVVVFDEASQIATWDAIGAIARGKQTIIVGDPKQLPPTNFFGKVEDDESDEELDDHEKDLESILDEAQASGLPTLQLNWHYRSRHESLIAFSNWKYYGNQLVTFPAAESEDRGVSLTHVGHAVYDRGKSRTNRGEAEAIVADLVARMKRCLAKPESQRLTYGVVTFNSQQQSLIEDFLDEAIRNDSKLEWFFSDDRIEPTAVKNLENVQGDERDVMYFSITFGKDAAGKFPVSFGAINKDGGERRLNVAVTRARQSLLVYSSFLPDELRAERSKARGIHDLKAFLEYAHKGPNALLSQTEGSVGGYDSPFEEAIAEALSSKGWQAEPQIGISGFRVDLGVIHPDLPGAYLAGVECDGATYHRSAAARDRDKTRQQVLENLGWSIVRVWSTDWWYDPESAIDAVHKRLQELLAAARKEMAAPDGKPTTGESEGALPPAADDLKADDKKSSEQAGDYESPFEEAVAQALAERGWQVDPQVNVSGYRIDLGVVHPSRSGEYLAAIECDGAEFHRSAAARDHDKSRQLTLEELGWDFVRIWSSDWWSNPEAVADKINDQLQSLLEKATSQPDSQVSLPVDVILREENLNFKPSLTTKINEREAGQHQLIAKHATNNAAPHFYQLADLGDASSKQERFYEDDYSRDLRSMALVVLEAEAPVRDDLLAKRVARAHGFGRTGSRIRDRVLSLIPEVTASTDDSGRFLWLNDSPREITPFRYAQDEDERRSLDEICEQELLGLLRERPDLLASEDPALSTAREVGLARLSKHARDRLEKVIALAGGGEA